MYKNYDISQILPHKKPMLLLNDVLSYNQELKTLTAIFVIEEENLFYDKKNKGVPSSVGIEYMAQTIGAYAFYKNNCTIPKIGLLLGARLFSTGIDFFKLNETYTVKVKEIFTDKQILAFDCIIFDNKNEEIASATVNVYQNDEIEDFNKNNG